MLNRKKGASAISLVLCGMALSLVVAALVVATNNSAAFKAQMIAEKQTSIIENSAYTKVYSLSEIKAVAKEAYVNNYLLLFDEEIGISDFEALILGEIQLTIPYEQLENYNIFVTQDGIEVQYK